MTWMLIDEAAAALGVSRSTLQRQIKDGSVPAKLEIGKRWAWVSMDPEVLVQLRAIRSELTELRSSLPQIRIPKNADTVPSKPPAASPRPSPVRRAARREEAAIRDWEGRDRLSAFVAHHGVAVAAKLLKTDRGNLSKYYRGVHVPRDHIRARFWTIIDADPA